MGSGSNGRAVRDILVSNPLTNVPDGLTINGVLPGGLFLGKAGSTDVANLIGGQFPLLGHGSLQSLKRSREVSPMMGQ